MTTRAKDFYYMFFALKSMSMYTVMRREEFFNRLAFFTNQKTVIFTWFRTLTGTPFAESGDMVHEFLFLEEFKNSVDRDSIYCEFFCDFIWRKSAMIFFEKGEYFLTCFRLSHIEYCNYKIINATLLQ